VRGKGSKERIVPMGEVARDWLVRYLQEARPSLVRGQMSDALFPSRVGGFMSRQNFWYAIKAYAKKAGIERDLVAPYFTSCLCYPFVESWCRFACGTNVVRA
jgi:integrase/recombinase XerD